MVGWGSSASAIAVTTSPTSTLNSLTQPSMERTRTLTGCVFLLSRRRRREEGERIMVGKAKQSRSE